MEFRKWNPESREWNPESSEWNPEYKDFLDYLTSGEGYLHVVGK